MASNVRYERAQTAGRRRRWTPIDAITGEQLMAVPCSCDPPRKHGPHWVRASTGGARGFSLADALRGEKVDR